MQPVAATPSTSAFHVLSIADLRESSWNPRKSFDDAKLQELAASIRQNGIVEPIVVRPLGPHDGDWGPVEIIAGARRYRAAKIAGLEEVPCVVRHLDDVAALELAVVENSQREDVHPLEEAQGYQALMKLGGKKNGYDVAHVAAKVGKSESYVYRRVRLLQLEDDLQAALAEDRLSIAHAEKLLRLPADLRAEAAHPEKGVVWHHSPLLDDAEWIPQRDDLRPLHDLENFIRTRHFLDVTDRDTPHFQEELAEQIEKVVDEEFTDTTDTPAAVEAFVASILSLSIDPMVRMRLRANPNDVIPLSPSKWREVEAAKDRCPHTVRGAITHGGPPRILDVCTKKSCAKHFPPAKKAKGPSKAQLASEKERRDREEREAEKRRVEEQLWEALRPELCAAFAKHVADIKVNAAFVRAKIDTYTLKRVKDEFGVALTDATAAPVLLLSGLGTHYRPHLESGMSSWGFDVKAFTKGFKDRQAEKGKATLKDQQQQLATKGAKTSAKKTAKKGARK